MEKRAQVISGWSWRQAGKQESWTRCKHDNAISEIFTDLLDAKAIPHPFEDKNEKLVQWVGEVDWEYSAEFEYSDAGHDFDDLVFEGLDTIATVYLNDEVILESDNMFHIHRVNVKGKLKSGVNKLRILFASAFNHGKKLEEKYGQLTCWNGDRSRLYVRKAQYHYGWDWGPVLMSCGPYKPIHLESYSANATDVFVDGDVSKDLSRVSVNVSFGVTSNKKDVDAEITIMSPNSDKVSTKVKASERTETTLSIDNPQLWYPIGYGKQDRYAVTIVLKSSDGKILYQEKRLVGFRKVELVQEPLQDAPGTSFYFRVNNIPIFCAGSNWIPAHSFLTALSADDYHKWIDKAVRGNQVMLRVWAGGIYEHDDFYSECDRVGILVWHDFMFGCGQYPYHDEIRKSIQREADDQLKRLRNYCSIVIYAGNNEDYQVAEQANLDWNPSDHSGDWTHTNFPARTAYETDLPKAVEKWCPKVPYHPGSPWGGRETSDPTVGDLHQWNVWHGTQEKYQNWAKLAGRFVSEFGMLALPSRSTIDKFVTQEDQKYPQSSVIEHHCKADGFERRLALYVMENITVRSMDLNSWIYATQLVQAECLAYAYRCWRREWRGDNKRYTSGALVWQINDCYPVSSWAICDFYRQNKLAYYAVKRESAPLGVGIYRSDVDQKNRDLDGEIPGPPHDLKDKQYVYDVWGVNSGLEDVPAKLVLTVYNVASGEQVGEPVTRKVVLEANKSTEWCEDLKVEHDCVVYAQVFDEQGKLLARAGDWPQPLKHLLFPDRKVQVTVHKGEVHITANKPVKGVALTAEGVEFEDNGVDVFPGETVVIPANIEPGTPIEYTYYERSN
uniref:Beta-mannosidase B n=1 Tax=Blastobotrys adeninivorans TaxID=409370 RepID=A0A060T3C9_BLAAD